MKTKQLGQTDLRIPALAFGGNVLGWTAKKEEAFQILDALFERGFNYIDTANVYSRWVDGHTGGESETVLGAWMKARKNREKIIIATKVGMDVGQGHIDLSASHIKEQIDLSLQRLQTDYVDVYFSHKDDVNTGIEDTLSTYQSLIKEGKVRYIGASNFSLERLKESIKLSKEQGLPRYEVLQPEYNLMQREDFEGAVQDFCIENSISTTSYFTLASGFLTGKYSSRDDIDGAERARFVAKYFTDKGMATLEALEKISKETGKSVAAITLTWTMTQPGITAPIASVSKISQLKAFYEAVEMKLTQEHMQLIDSAQS